jgi:tRNA(Ile)-lysidine synthase TilS/MesJ
MKEIDKKRKIYRPLIHLTKKEIQKKCDELKILYFIDKTNFDSEISKRNFIRNEILEKLEQEF